MPLAKPVQGSPPTVQVLSTQEKGSDVNLAAHLVHDARDVEHRIDVRVREDAGVHDLQSPFDQEARVVQMEYSKKDPLASLAHLTRQRHANVKWLRTLRPGQLRRRGVHESVGEITAGEMIHEWAFHDLGHLKQILEVKRYALWPRIGNLRAFYRMS